MSSKVGIGLFVVSTVLYLVGYIFVWVFSNGWVAFGLLLFVWGNNIFLKYGFHHSDYTTGVDDAYATENN